MSLRQIIVFLLAVLLIVPAAPAPAQSPAPAQGPAPEQKPAAGRQPAITVGENPASHIEARKQSALGGTIFGGALPDFARGYSHIPYFFKPYQPMNVPEPDLVGNSPRVEQLIREGKFYLSLSDAIALALENNLDVAIQRYNPLIADTDILRTKAGTALRGVRTSVTGASAVGVSGGAAGAQGGTGTTAGGVGQGSSGLVTSALGAGPPIGSFDPVFTSQLGIEHRAQPITSVVTQRVQGLNSLKIAAGTANFGYAQAFHSGTQFNVTLNNSRQTNILNSLNPQINSNFQLQLTQHLLQGFGFAPNTRNIRIARNNREVSDLVFKQQVILTVSQVQNLYWDLVSASENVKVAERSLQVAEKTYNDNKRQVEIGTLAPIEIVRAEAEVAARRQDLIVAQTNYQQLGTSMKNLVLRNVSDPIVSGGEVVPTDRITVPPVEPVVPIQELVGTALSSRPELAQSRIDLHNREITIKAVKNGLRPNVDAFAFWGGTGTAGDPSSPSFVDNLRSAGYLGGLGRAYTNLIQSDFPDYAFGLNLQIPIKNRTAQADAAQAQLEERQAEVRLRQLENQVRVEVTNALIGLQQNRARIEAAQKQRELAERSLDAEQKKFQLGASTIFQVIQAQRDLTAALSNEVAALGAYMKSRVEVDRSTGQTIFKNGILLDEAFQGRITKPPQALPVTKQD